MAIQLISRREDEQSLCERFLATVHDNKLRNELRSSLRNLLKEFSAIFPAESVLSRTRDTLWIPAWVQAYPRLKRSTRFLRLYALKRIMRYQYESGSSDNDILETLRLPCEEASLAISFPQTVFSIQRELEDWFAGVSNLSRQAQSRYRARILRFAVFSGPRPEPWPTQKMVEVWIKSLSHLGQQSIWDHIHSLERFLKCLHEKQLIPVDPIGSLRQRYPIRGLRGIVTALAQPDPERALARLQSQCTFQGPIGQRMNDYLELKRASGRIYDYESSILLNLNRFLSDRSLPLTAENFGDWMRSLDHLHSATQSHYFSQGRQFCEFLRRSNSSAFVPVRDCQPTVRPPRIPVILSKAEIDRLFEAAAQMSRPRRAPLRQPCFYLILTFLYCCGLRLGEVLRLDLGDVDLQRGVLTVRNTKFFKSRLVPLDVSVVGILRHFLELRKKAGVSTAQTAPLFCSSRGGRYFKNTVRTGILDLMESIGIRTKQRLVRVHDLRHTFAVHRLIQWYRDGEEVQARLPILSQYMGHVDIAYTHHYLSLVPELCEAAMLRFQQFATPLRRIDHET